MAIISKNSKDYIQVANSLIKPGYNSQYGNQISNIVDEIINKGDFNYDFENDPAYQQYKNQYVNLGKDAVQNAVSAASGLTGGYGNSYSATAASQANQQYLTRLNQQIPQLMNAAMNRYQMEQETLQKQFGALGSAEGLAYGKYRDEVSDYNNDLAFIRNGYASALSQKNKETTRDYQAARDAVSDKQWRENLDYKKSRDDVSDARWQENLDYKRQRAQVSDDQWQKEFELKQMQQALKAAKSSSGGSGRRSGGSDNAAESFFKMQGTAAVKNYSGNKVDTSRNATLSVTKTRNFLNQLLEAGSDSEAQQILNSWAESGYISEGDYNYLVDYYEKLKERGIGQLKEWKSPKIATTTNAGAKQSTTKNSTKEEKSSNIFKRAIEKVKQLTK